MEGVSPVMAGHEVLQTNCSTAGLILIVACAKLKLY